MGLGSSSYRLLQLTERKNDVGRRMQFLSAEKLSLTKSSEKISQEYQNTINAKTLKWSNNGGVTYNDLSYSYLMNPNSSNKNTPFVITDNYDRVVTDNKYTKYAEMISANGAAGGDYESNRTKILSGLTGLDASVIENAGAYSKSVTTAKENLANIKAREPKASDYGIEITGTYPELLKKLGESTGSTNGAGFSKGANWSEAYAQGGTISLGGNVANIDDYINGILVKISEGLTEYMGDDATLFEETCNSLSNTYRSMFSGNGFADKDLFPQDSNGNYSVNVTNLVNQIFATFASKGGNVNTASKKCTWINVDDTANYNRYKTDRANWETEYKNAQEAYTQAKSSNNSLLTAEQESQIKFYDQLFSMIAEKGWTQNNAVHDNDYLNQMLQNNYYTITTIGEKEVYNDKTGQYETRNSYDTDIALNCNYVFSVSDSEKREDARSEYESKKAIISAKESILDTEMKNLQTEESALAQEIQSLEKIKNDNIERTMNTFA